MKLALLAAAACTACAAGRWPAVSTAQAYDVAAAIDCTARHWGQPWPQLLLSCWQANEAAAADVLADFYVVLDRPHLKPAGGATMAMPPAALPEHLNVYRSVPSVEVAYEAKVRAL